MGYRQYLKWNHIILALLCALIHVGTSQDDTCWQKFGRSDFRQFENSCFWVSDTDTRYRNGAQLICEEWKGNLATITRIETLEFLKKDRYFEGSKSYWIGLHINASELLSSGNYENDREQNRRANWKWLDGTTYDYHSGLGWHTSDPYRQFNSVLLGQSKWWSGSSQTQHLFICETKLASTSTITTTPTTTTSVPEVPKPTIPTGSEPGNRNCGTKEWTNDQNANKCYAILKKDAGLSWTAARDECVVLGGQLASPSTQQQHEAVVSIIGKENLNGKDVWIGLSRSIGTLGSDNLFVRRGGWQWLDGSPYDGGFVNWAIDEPGGNEKYVRLRDAMWYAIREDASQIYYICQKEPNIPVTMAPIEPDYSQQTTARDTLVISQHPPDGGNVTNSPRDNGSVTLGVILGVIIGVILVAFVVATILLKRRGSARLESALSRIKIRPFSKKQTVSGAQGHTYSNVEIYTVTPSAATSQSVLIASEVDKSPKLRKENHTLEPPKVQPKPEMLQYATVPPENLKMNSPKLLPKPEKSNDKKPDKKPIRFYETMKNFVTHPKPKMNKALSLETLDLASGSEYENTIISTVVRVEELNDWVKEATASGLVERQYKSVPTSDPTKSKDFCNQEHLKPKNRYRNMVPYDDNRVELSTLANEPHSHYINASYIDSYEQKKTFVAAQGPTAQTVNDFWRMIWEKSMRTVVMVSNQFEPEKVKMNFAQYWPKGKEKEYFGDVAVSIKKVENLPDYIIRHISAAKDSDIRIVKHFHFKAWPDHNVPKHAMALINFREKIRGEMSNSNAPVLVHCSAGVGRTGTYIAIDYLLQQAAKEGVLDFVSCLKKLRQQRTDMVQRLVQYQFIIRAVLEALTLGQTAIPCSQYNTTVLTFRDPLTDGETRMQKQFEMLAHYFTEDKSSDESPGELPENRDKNRDTRVLPAPSKRVLLMTPVSGRNDYINAVFMDGHRRKSAYIATHAPLENTVVDFWRATFDYNSTVIVMLCPKYYLKTEEVYFPEGMGEKLDVAPFEIECMEEDEQSGVRRAQFSLKYCGLERHILHFSLTEDLAGMTTGEKMTTLYSIYENAKKWQQQQTEKKAPITVHCLEGTEWTGLYCTLCNLFDQVNEEQEVDIFNAVGQGRLARRQFVSTMEQYEMIYDIINLYIDQFSLYSNFQ